MKWQRMILRIALCLSIVTSFYLSYLIWLNPTKTVATTPIASETNTQGEMTTKNFRSLTDVFLPLQLVSVTDSQANETNSEQLIKSVLSEIGSSEMEQPKWTSYESADVFIEKTTIKNGFDFIFMNRISLNEAIDLFDLKLDLDAQLLDKELMFDQMSYNSETKTIHFVDAAKKSDLSANVTVDESEIATILKQEKVNWQRVTFTPELLLQHYLVDQPVQMKLYSYISTVQPYSVFRDSFFHRPQEATLSDDTNDLMLTDQSEVMTVQLDNRLVEYRDTDMTGIHDNLYVKSYDYIRNLGMNYGNLRFLDRYENTLNYRIFVEGFPVFSNQNDGLVSMQFTEKAQNQDEWSVKIAASLNTIQIPIPSDKLIELPSNKSVLLDLQAQGLDLSRVSAIMVGYEWSDIKDTNVVDLVPTWYIKYDHKWQSQDALSRQLQQSAGEH